MFFVSVPSSLLLASAFSYRLFFFPFMPCYQQNVSYSQLDPMHTFICIMSLSVCSCATHVFTVTLTTHGCILYIHLYVYVSVYLQLCNACLHSHISYSQLHPMCIYIYICSCATHVFTVTLATYGCILYIYAVVQRMSSQSHYLRLSPFYFSVVLSACFRRAVLSQAWDSSNNCLKSYFF